jgi:hypothetical protein
MVIFESLQLHQHPDLELRLLVIFLVVLCFFDAREHLWSYSKGLW